MSNAEHYVISHDSPIGKLAITSNQTHLTGVWFEGRSYYGLGYVDRTKKKNVPILDKARSWLDGYFAGEKPDSSVPMDLIGTDIQLNVWRLLSHIPYGAITTYGEIAKALPALMHRGPVSPRSVGGAVGKNPISILIPCHRVVGANGALVGFGGGLPKKTSLLSLELKSSGEEALRHVAPNALGHFEPAKPLRISLTA
jgi:methylated-DNA-[protein]-cysteine S-methyltransferase